jgi:hypothetical protein
LRIPFSCTVLLVLLAAVTPARAQGWNPPTEAQRCPSKWGAADTRGSANHVKPASVLAALQLVKTGQIIELGRVLESSMPVFGTRRFDLHTKRTGINPGRNRRGTNVKRSYLPARVCKGRVKARSKPALVPREP